MHRGTRGALDRLLDGGVDSWLTSQRESGLSYDSIARNLLLEYGVAVTGQTVQNWCRELPGAA